MDRLSRKVKIVNVLGMHARAAARLASLAQAARGAVWIAAGGERADATSVIDILALGCGQGCEVTLEIDNEADLGTLELLAALIHEGFGESSIHA